MLQDCCNPDTHVPKSSNMSPIFSAKTCSPSTKLQPHHCHRQTFRKRGFHFLKKTNLTNLTIKTLRAFSHDSTTSMWTARGKPSSRDPEETHTQENLTHRIIPRAPYSSLLPAHTPYPADQTKEEGSNETAHAHRAARARTTLSSRQGQTTNKRWKCTK